MSSELYSSCSAVYWDKQTLLSIYITYLVFADTALIFLKGVTFIVYVSMAAVLHRKPACAGMSCYSVHFQGQIRET